MQKGTTLIELIVIMAVVGILSRLVTLDLFRGQQRASLIVSRDLLVSDIRKQQHRAMEGLTPSQGTYLDYSIRFEEQRYIVYPGVVYDSENPANDVIVLDSILRFEPIDIPDNTISFSRISGEVRGFDVAHNRVTLKNIQTANQYVVRVNSLGVPFVE